MSSLAHGTAAADFLPITPEEAAFAPDTADRLDDAVRSGRAAAGIHGIVVVRDGRLASARRNGRAGRTASPRPRRACT